MEKRSNWTTYLGLVVSLLLVGIVAVLGGQSGPSPWYRELPKPDWTPPSWLFAPVWTTLYILMAVAAWLVWRKHRQRPDEARNATLALTVYGAQLALNALWSWLFFGLHLIGLALAELVALWIAIVITCFLFWRVRRLAGILFLPYIAWVAFAGFLNYGVWVLNR